MHAPVLPTPLCPSTSRRTKFSRANQASGLPQKIRRVEVGLEACLGLFPTMQSNFPQCKPKQRKKQPTKAIVQQQEKTIVQQRTATMSSAETLQQRIQKARRRRHKRKQKTITPFQLFLFMTSTRDMTEDPAKRI